MLQSVVFGLDKIPDAGSLWNGEKRLKIKTAGGTKES